VAVERCVATKLDRDRRAVTQYDVSDLRLEALYLSEEAAVKAELVDDRWLDLTGELRIEDLVGVTSELRSNRYAPKEVGPTLPPTVEELALVDEGCAIAHSGSGRFGRRLELLA